MHYIFPLFDPAQEENMVEKLFCNCVDAFAASITAAAAALQAEPPVRPKPMLVAPPDGAAVQEPVSAVRPPAHAPPISPAIYHL